VSSLTAPHVPATRARTEHPAPAIARAAQALGALSLIGLVAASGVIVAIAAERPSFLAPVTRPGFFPSWMVGPLRGLWPGLTGNGDTLAWLVSALIAGMYALYVAACRLAPRLHARWTIAAVIAIHVVFFLAPPLSYTDVFNYINYGRMGVVHGLNPYGVLPALEPHTDPSFGLSNWHHLLSPYGPLFTLLTYALVPLGVTLSFWALKLLVGAASLATLVLVWKCAQVVGRSETAAVVFVGCNPIVLIWGLGADHNDAMMMLFVVLAVYLDVRGRGASGQARGFGARSAMALIAAVFIKASAAVLVPVFLAAGSMRRFLAGAFLAAGIFGLASVIAFGTRLPDLSTQGRLVTAIGIPNLVGLALGQGGETATLHAAFSLALLLTVAACTVWVFCRPRDWGGASAVALLVLVVSLSWAAPWYVLWILPFAALSSARALRAVVVVLGAYLILAFMPAAVLLAGDIGFRPAATPLGLRHTAEIDALVR